MKKKAWKTKASRLVLLIVGILVVFSVFQIQNLNTINLSFPNPNHSPASVNNKPRSTPSSSSSARESNDAPPSSGSKSKIPRWRPSKVDEELVKAKIEIENSPSVINDEQLLYPPIFRNISAFKRSYQLMEEMLKVYVYKEGDKPVFHQPFLSGLYASEGWFMKQMKESKHFLIDDPSKAHLFYIPFSSVKLRFSMYNAETHNHKELVNYTKSYIQLISSKYAFWNRTGGADHFVAACHDWVIGTITFFLKVTKFH